MTLGMYCTKIRQHDKDIEEIKNRVNASSEIFQTISNQLAELNTKVSLLIDGKIEVKK